MADQRRTAPPPSRPAGRGGVSALGRWAAGSSSRRLLVAEFIACMIVLLLAPLSSKHRDDDVHAWIRRWFGITGLFLLLSMTAMAGDRVARVAAALGGLATIALLINDADALTNMFSGAASASASGGSTAAPGKGHTQSVPIPGTKRNLLYNVGGAWWAVGIGQQGAGG